MKGIGQQAQTYISPFLGQGCTINIYMKIIYNTHIFVIIKMHWVVIIQ